MNKITLDNGKSLAVTELENGEFEGTFLSFNLEMRSIVKLNDRPIKVRMAEVLEIGFVTKYYFEYIDIPI